MWIFFPLILMRVLSKVNGAGKKEGRYNESERRTQKDWINKRFFKEEALRFHSCSSRTDLDGIAYHMDI